MSYQAKRKIMNSTVYIVLAIVITAIICITVITFTSAHRGVKPVTSPVGTPETAITTSIKTDKTPTTAQTTPGLTDTDVVDTETDTPAINTDIIEYTLPAQGYVMKEYSIDLPVFSLTLQDYRAHTGIDISIAEGEAVYSIAAGTIKDIYEHPMLGTTIVIEHSGGVASMYSNLDKTIPDGITKGVSVGEGQLIGAAGNTSISEIAESDHIHFEMTVDGKRVNPLDYLDFSKISKEDIPGNE